MSQIVHVARYGALYQVTLDRPSANAIDAAMRFGEGLSAEVMFKAMWLGRVPAYSAALASEDAREGPRAFAENRPPVWTGR
ncbi:MAG: hypothetical protein ACLPSW_00535 [Roseiarcus sp.]